jgi:hypothetical protein
LRNGCDATRKWLPEQKFNSKGHGDQSSNISGPALKRFALLLCSRLASARSAIHPFPNISGARAKQLSVFSAQLSVISGQHLAFRLIRRILGESATTNAAQAASAWMANPLSLIFQGSAPNSCQFSSTQLSVNSGQHLAFRFIRRILGESATTNGGASRVCLDGKSHPREKCSILNRHAMEDH